jgi:hypothetical protein
MKVQKVVTPFISNGKALWSTNLFRAMNRLCMTSAMTTKTKYPPLTGVKKYYSQLHLKPSFTPGAGGSGL